MNLLWLGWLYNEAMTAVKNLGNYKGSTFMNLNNLYIYFSSTGCVVIPNSACVRNLRNRNVAQIPMVTVFKLVHMHFSPPISSVKLGPTPQVDTNVIQRQTTVAVTAVCLCIVVYKNNHNLYLLYMIYHYQRLYAFSIRILHVFHPAGT